MDFVDRHRLAPRIALAARRPCSRRRSRRSRRCRATTEAVEGRSSASKPNGIGLQRQQRAVGADDLVFVDARRRRARERRSPTGRCRRACASGSAGRPSG